MAVSVTPASFEPEKRPNRSIFSDDGVDDMFDVAPSYESPVVTGLSGEEFTLSDTSELQWYRNTVANYQKVRTIDSADYNDFDLLLAQELQVHRIKQMIASGRDARSGRDLTASAMITIQKQLQTNIQTARILKNSLGLSREARRAEEGSVQEYLEDLRVRAKQFGVKRNEEMLKAIWFLKELEGHIGAFDRADENERERIGFPTEAELIQWIRVEIQNFNDIDALFQKSKQTYWVGKV